MNAHRNGREARGQVDGQMDGQMLAWVLLREGREHSGMAVRLLTTCPLVSANTVSRVRVGNTYGCFWSHSPFLDLMGSPKMCFKNT